MSIKQQTQKIAVLGILAGITALLSFVMIPVFGIEMCFAMVPVGIGAIMFGTSTGAVLGGVFGICSFVQAFGLSAFGVMMLEVNPLYTFITCVPTRILAGLLCGLIFTALKKSNLGLLVASVSAPVLNTLLFMSSFILCFWQSDFVKTMAGGIVNPFAFAVAFVGINGLLETVSGFVVIIPVAKAAIKAFKLH